MLHECTRLCDHMTLCARTNKLVSIDSNNKKIFTYCSVLYFLILHSKCNLHVYVYTNIRINFMQESQFSNLQCKILCHKFLYYIYFYNAIRKIILHTREISVDIGKLNNRSSNLWDSINETNG